MESLIYLTPVTSLVLAIILSVLLSDKIRKYPVAFYIGSFVFAISQYVMYDWMRQNEIKNVFLEIISRIFVRGAFGTSLFIIVMFATLFKKGSYLRKAIMPIRGELSIIACIFVFLHNIQYGIYRRYFIDLFVNNSEMSLSKISAAIISLVMIAILIPLFITSFKSVRKKMDSKAWKKLQSLAYIYYGLIYVHVMVLYVPALIKVMEKAPDKAWRYNIGIPFYTVVFLLYAAFRIKKYISDNKNIKTS